MSWKEQNSRFKKKLNSYQRKKLKKYRKWQRRIERERNQTLSINNTQSRPNETHHKKQQINQSNSIWKEQIKANENDENQLNDIVKHSNWDPIYIAGKIYIISYNMRSLTLELHCYVSGQWKLIKEFSETQNIISHGWGKNRYKVDFKNKKLFLLYQAKPHILLKIFDIETKKSFILKLDPLTSQSYSSKWNEVCNQDPLYMHQITDFKSRIDGEVLKIIIYNWYRNNGNINRYKILSFPSDIIDVIGNLVQRYMYTLEVTSSVLAYPLYTPIYYIFKIRADMDERNDENYFEIIDCKISYAQKRDDTTNSVDYIPENGHHPTKFVFNKINLYDNEHVRRIFVFEYKIGSYNPQNKKYPFPILYTHLHLFDKDTKTLSMLQENCPFPLKTMCADYRAIIGHGENQCNTYIVYDYEKQQLHVLQRRLTNHLHWILNIAPPSTF